MGAREQVSPANSAVSPLDGMVDREDQPLALDYEISIVVGRNNRDTHPKEERVTLRQLAGRWATPDTRRGQLKSAEYHALDKKQHDQKKRRDQEKNGENFATMVLGGDGTRRDANVVSLTGFVLDFDSGRTTRRDIEQRLEGLAYFAYTSYSHLAVLPHWRVLVPYRQPIGRDQHQLVYDYMQAIFNGDVDKKCGTPSQIYYTPACPIDAADQYEFCCHDGKLFDVENLPQADREWADGENDDNDSEDVDQGEGGLARLKDALTFINPDDRKLWIDVGMAIKHDLAEGGLATWLDWGQRSKKFVMVDAVCQWQSMQPKQGRDAITLNTVYWLARKSGWKPLTNVGVPAEIAKMNLQYFLAPYGGKVPVFREVVDPFDGYVRAEPLSPADFRLLHADEKVWSEDAYGKPKAIPLGEYWLHHRGRRKYAGIVFAPEMELPGYYNRWRGFGVAPRKGTWRLMRRHLLFVICRGDRRHYRYLLNWMADAVQSPGRPAEVAVVLKGGRGAGKGVFARSFGKLFGPHFLQITQPSHLTGHFNGHLESCVVLFVDEAIWAGDKQGEGVLKGLVTEPTIAIEPKHFGVVTARNCLHIVVASNSDWVIPAGSDERRFFVLEVDDARKQDPAYFGPLYAEMEGTGLAAMLYDLKQRDLSRFNIRHVPQNSALGEQKMQSLDPFGKWWFGKLVAGEFEDYVFGLGTKCLWGRVPTNVVHADYVRSVGKTGVTRKATETELGVNLKKWLPPGTTLRVRATVDREQVPHYDFPPLDACRVHFEQRMNLAGQIDWTSGGMNEKTT